MTPQRNADYSQASFALAAGEGLRGNRMQVYDLGFSGATACLVEDELGVGIVQPAQFIERRFVHMAGGDIRFTVDLLHTDRPVGILLTGKGTYVALGAESFSLSDVAGRGR